METFNIRYNFTLKKGAQVAFHMQFDAANLELVDHTPLMLPEWTYLDFHQCPNCPLTTKAHPFCPLVANIANIIERLEDVKPDERIHVQVLTQERLISQDTSAQKGISSLMGLIMATCGCPHMAYFRPMARFHLPLASEEETIYRATSMYLLAQFFLKEKGLPVDFNFEGLAKVYENVQSVNSGISMRLKAADEAELTINAINVLNMFAKAIPFVINESLGKIKYLFKPYLDYPIDF